MTRWIMIGMTVLGLLMAIFTRSPGLLGLALLMLFVGICGTVFSLAADRVSANSRSDVAMLPPEAILAIRDKANAAAAARQQAARTGAEVRQSPAALPRQQA